MEASSERGSLFRMASFRLAVLGTMLSTIGAIIVFAMIYGATATAARQEFSPIIAGDEADLFADALAGSTSLRQQIDLAVLQSRHTFYAFADAKGTQRAGNIPMPPDPLGWHSFNRWAGQKLPPGVSAIDGIGFRLDDGDILFIGEDASVFARMNTDVAYLFAAVFGFVTLVGLLASMLIAAYSLKRVRAISDASRQIMAGDLSHRIKLHGIDDELDVLTTDLNLMLATIENLVENARQVTSDIAHDLRAPLTRLRDQLVLVRRRADAEIVPMLDTASAQADQVIAIFAALLRIAEVEAGASRANFAAMDPCALCRVVGEAYQPVAEDRDQRLLLDIGAGHLMHGDRDLFVQMIVNIVENAIRHSPPGVAMTLRARDGGEILTIEMEDRGPGIAEPERERVFKRFVRLDAARNTAGHGLGLPLVRAVAMLHGGKATLHDNHPGLTVRIILARPAALGPDEVAAQSISF